MKGYTGYVHTIPDSFISMPKRKAIRYSKNTYPICDSPLKRSAHFRSVIEIALKSPFLCVNRSPIRYFRVFFGIFVFPAQKLSGIMST